MKDYDGNHTTAKALAQQVLMDAITGKMEFFVESLELDQLTEKQKQQVYEQGCKLATRLAKVLQFEYTPGTSFRKM